MSRVTAIGGLDPATYTASALHAEDRVWVEKNCYIDVFVELVHALGLEPRAMLPFVVAVDFEPDQWTFFKPSHDELWDLYGLDVQELNVWRPLLDQALDYLPKGRLVSTEADAFWLPDTKGTDYQRNHVKTTIILNDLDLAAKRLGYFHNSRYHGLEGADFDALFRLGAPPDPTFMPLFAEAIRTDRLVRRSAADLAHASAALLRRHLARRPAENPVARFGEAFGREVLAMGDKGLEHYHAWAFANLRQLGAAFELAAENARWLTALEVADLADAALAFDAVSGGAKTLILKTARAVNGKRALDASALFGEMSSAWQRGVEAATRATAAR